MTVEDLAGAASANVVQTYCELASGVLEGRRWREAGFLACVSPLEHPMGNFAANLDLTPTSAERLVRIATGKAHFNVYSMPVDLPSDRDRILRNAGFVRTQEFVQMVAQPPLDEPKLTLTRAATLHDRGRIADFMVEQFFSRHPRRIKEQIAETTARVTRLELLGLCRDGNFFAAAMISRTEGMTGIYNVCVDSGVRGLGIGSGLIREILAVCSQRQTCATLQCDAKLEQWYRAFGFSRSGIIRVYAAPQKPKALL